jgi:hypothetical protein
VDRLRNAAVPGEAAGQLLVLPEIGEAEVVLSSRKDATIFRETVETEEVGRRLKRMREFVPVEEEREAGKVASPGLTGRTGGRAGKGEGRGRKGKGGKRGGGRKKRQRRGRGKGGKGKSNGKGKGKSKGNGKGKIAEEEEEAADDREAEDFDLMDPEERCHMLRKFEIMWLAPFCHNVPGKRRMWWWYSLVVIVDLLA